MKNSFSYGLPSTEYSMKLSAGEGEGKGSLRPNFQGGGGGGLDRISVFRGGVAGKEGVTFFKWLKFLQKKKSEIFNDKKVYKQKYFSLS